MAEGLGNLFQNQLFLQYLAAAGQDIGSGNAIGSNVNAATQQQISSQNFMKMLQKMLGDAASPETPSKVTMDGTSLKYETDMSELGKQIFPGAAGGAGVGGTTGLNKVGMSEDNRSILDFLNPSSSPLGDFSGADLAGLTPEMISQALGLKYTGEKLENEKISSIIDRIYKGQLGGYYEALTKQAQPVFTIPGTDIKLDREDYLKWYKDTNADERTAAIKDYEYAKTQGYTGSFMDFQDSSRATSEKEYDRAVQGGYTGSFQNWKRDIAALGGGINLEEFTKRKEVTEDIEAKSTIKSAKFLSDVEKEVKADTTLDQYGIGTPEYDKAVKLEVLKKLDSAIRNAYKDKEITRTAEGWFADGKLIRRNPYAR